MVALKYFRTLCQLKWNSKSSITIAATYFLSHRPPIPCLLPAAEEARCDLGAIAPDAWSPMVKKRRKEDCTQGRRGNLLGFEPYRSHSEGSSCELCQLLAYKHLCHQANDRDLNAVGLRLSNTAEDIARITGRQRTEYHQQL